MKISKIVLVFICLPFLAACGEAPKAAQCVLSVPKGWVTWEEDNGKTICWKSKGFQCAPKCKEN